MNRKISFPGISGSTLKLLAMFLMLLDHMWRTVIPGNLWMTCLGRLAFPIFAFQIAEGYRHTKDIKKYMKRLFIFALISEIPFNCMISGGFIFPFGQNVMFTLLLGLIAVWQIDILRKCETMKEQLCSLFLLLLISLAAWLGMTDYGLSGVMTVIVFYLFHDFRYCRLCQLLSLFAVNFFWLEGMQIELSIANLTVLFPVQGFAILALVPI